MNAKRIFDLFTAGIVLTLLLPILVVIALMVRRDSPGPAIFAQERVGRAGAVFKIYKYRTMIVNERKPTLQITVGNDPRITKIGSFLRKWKLDELPQLWNVIVGDMSLVGPRPEVPRYVAFYPPAIREIVLSVRPGITDPCSIQFLNESKILKNENNPEHYYINNILPQKLDIYVNYIENKNFMSDVFIILKTVKSILRIKI